MEALTQRPRAGAHLGSILIVWLVAYGAWTADWLLQPMPFMLDRSLRRILVCAFGALLCWAMLRPLDRGRPHPFSRRVVGALGLCVGASLAESAFSQLVFYVVAPRWGPASLTDWLVGSLSELWVFLAWTALYFARDYDAVARAATREPSDPGPAPEAARDHPIWVPEGSARRRLAPDELLWVQAERDFVRLHTKSRSYLLRDRIGAFEKRLPPDLFARVHRSVIVRLDAVEEVRRTGDRSFSLTTRTGAVIAVGRGYAEVARRMLRPERAAR